MDILFSIIGLGLLVLGAEIIIRGSVSFGRKINSPLLESGRIDGAKGCVVNITGGEDLTLDDVNAVGEIISDVVDQDANIILGTAINKSMEGEVQVTMIATGFETNQPLKQQRLKNRLSNTPLYNFSDNKDTGANIPEFLRLRQNKKDID